MVVWLFVVYYESCGRGTVTPGRKLPHGSFLLGFPQRCAEVWVTKLQKNAEVK